MLNVTTDYAKILDNCTKEFKRLQKQAEPLVEEMRNVLLKVRDKKYYKARYKTFEAYCIEELGYSKSYAYRLIKAAGVNHQLTLPPSNGDEETSPIGDKIKQEPSQPLRESQARELANVPEAERAKVLKRASRKGKRTAATIKEAAEAEKVSPIGDIIERDEEGHVVPIPAIPTWRRRKEVDDYLRQLSKIKSWAEKLQKTTDVFYKVKEFSAQEVFTDCGNMYRMIKNLVPHSICAVCQGQAPTTCALCHGRGMIGKHTWDRGVDSQTKAMMKKKAEDDATPRLPAESR